MIQRETYMSNAHLCTAEALHDEIIRRAEEIQGKVYLFFDEIQEADACSIMGP